MILSIAVLNISSYRQIIPCYDDQSNHFVKRQVEIPGGYKHRKRSNKMQPGIGFLRKKADKPLKANPKLFSLDRRENCCCFILFRCFFGDPFPPEGGAGTINK